MDEPTAALGVFQTARVLDLMRNVRDQGIAKRLGLKLTVSAPDQFAADSQIPIVTP